MSTNTNIVSLQELRNQLTARMNEQKDTLPPSQASAIKLTRGEGFVLPDGRSADTINAIVVDMRYVNTFYTKRYVPGQMDPPACWAVGRDANNLTPGHEKPMHESCAANGELTCPKNQWGSDTGGGKGKACQNRVKLALITPDATDKTPVFTMTLPPTSLSGLAATLRKELNSGHALQDLVFEFSMDAKVDYPKVISKVVGKVPDAMLPVVFAKMEAAQEKLDRGFDYD